MKRISLLMLALALLVPLAASQAKEQKNKPTAPGQGAEQEVINLENEWTNAYVHGDTAALERIEADGYLYTDPGGKVSGKAEDIADVKAGGYKLQSFTPENMKVHLFGDTAVVTGHGLEKGTAKGKDTSGTYAYTDIFIKRGGRWQAIASQFTKIK
jgi:ketosteroid isomerase-like protein